MICEIFKALLITSLAGSALTVVISLFRPITKRIFGYSWHYYIWLCVLFVMLMPVRFNMGKASTTNIATQPVHTEQTTVSEHLETAKNIVQTNTAQKPQLLQKATVIWDMIIYNRMNILAYLWLIGAIALMLLNIVRYVVLNTKIRKNSEVISCPEISEYTDRKINVRVWENIASPFMTGVFRPTLILPKTELSYEQLHNILHHEITHFKRHDILYKWFAELVKCLHWFNPASWYVSKQIAAECEISCDMAVTKNMSRSEELSYINTILSLLTTGKSKQLPLTTQMASSKKILKRRFTMIRNKKKTSRFISFTSAVIALILLSATVFASGLLSNLTTDDYTIEIMSDGKKVGLTNKPFIENGEVYVPLREFMQKLEIGNKDSIVWDNGKISLYLKGHTDYYTIKIGDKTIRYNSVENLINSLAIRDVKNPPLLMNGTTFIPYEYIDCIFNRFDNYYKTDFSVYDKNGNDITVSVTNAWESEKESAEMSDPFRTAELFFKAFYNQDFEKMKNYCTQNCIDNFFGNNYVFGMKKAAPLSIGTVGNLTEKGFTDDKWAALVNVTMTPDENSVFEPDQTTTSFYLILKRQNDKYLIDEFATGL